MRRIAVLGAVGAGVTALVVAAVVIGRFRSADSSAPPAAPPLVRAPRVYREQLEPSRYVNRDLGFTLPLPKDWDPSLGKRQEELPPYEGLVLKIESRREPDEETKFRPLVSVFKKSLPAGTSADPVAYIRSHLISAPKTVTEAPKLVAVAGRSVGTVAYDMPAAKGVLKVRQVVRILGAEAIIFTSFVPAKSATDVAATVDSILGSIDWSS